ncbi:protein kilB [Streptomyces sp. NBC_00669]|uniref:protein kilB n=1 Tax=Streptomyces sp. NBC_00669 TaxID=2976011 RepID=UPI002E31EDD7|nr:protein kilB [Streptomyces sp. NBC_00669]
MFSAVIAVIGTLAGSVVAYILQERAGRAARADARAADQAKERLAALTALVSALADHRRAMWVREDLRLTGDAPEAYAAARAESHATRAAITAPLTMLAILAPELAPVAREAADATYALRGAPDPDALTARRTEAIAAVDRLIAEGARN